MRTAEELPIIEKTYQLILWSCNHTSRFPRNHRFVLGERIERNLFELLEALLRAKYTRERKAILIEPPFRQPQQQSPIAAEHE